jgi:hypothetical protein
MGCCMGRKACTGKRSYPNYEVAKLAADMASRNSGGYHYRAYFCSDCKRYHIANQREEPKGEGKPKSH